MGWKSRASDRTRVLAWMDFSVKREDVKFGQIGAKFQGHGGGFGQYD